MYIKIINIVFIVLLLTIAGFLIYSFIQSIIKHGKKGILNNLSEVLHSKYKKPKEAIKKLSIKEKLELSWQFLYNITNKIMTSFSAHDKERIRVCSNILKQYNMRYIHVVDPNYTSIIDKSTGVGKDLQQDIKREV